MMWQGKPQMDSQQDARSQAVPATILVVDDEPQILTYCKPLLEAAGFTVLEADGSSEALKICTHHKGAIDLLLTDLVLPPPGFQLASTSNQFPHVNGHELALRAAMIRKGLRIILMSGNLDKDLASHGIKRGSLPFLVKPFGKDDLVNMAHEILAQPAPALNRSATSKSGSDVEWFD
jgi:DNA-binding NtrC family response regulator